MSRRKQQNPKPVKYDEDKSKMASRAKEIEREIQEQGSPDDDSKSDDGESSSPIPSANPAAHYSTQGADPDVSIKDEPPSPVERENVSPTPPASEMSLEAKLGVPDDAPLKVQRRADDDGYIILSAKPISKGAGLDPLRAQRIEPPDDRALIKNNPQIVSFESISKGRIFFLLESAINCGWLKYIGSPGDDFEANLRIYYVGGQLWVEVIKNLTEGEELIAEFCDPSKDGKMHQQDNSSETVVRPPSPPKSTRTQANNQSDSPYPCTLCGISFRNPNTLAAHKKHYCSKLNSPTTSTNVNSETRSPGSSAANADDIKDPTSDNLQQTAYICTVCKFMSLTQADMKTHVREKHKTKQDAMEAASRINGLSSDKTYCDDCEIHFKKPESYQAHKQHYCKNRTNTNSPRSDNGAASSQQSLSQSTSPLSPSSKEMYKKVSVFDNQTLTASLATQAAAAMAAASLPFTLSSMLNLPGAVAAATLPMMPHLKMFQSPALLAQAMQNAVKTGGAATSSTNKDETAPLDLTVKQEMLAASAGSMKRKSEDTDSDMSPPMKRSASVHSNSTPGPISPASESGMPILPRHPASVKPSPKRTIYRCESCSIPFYKREVYEAHKQHYCAHRSNNTSDKEDDMISSPTKAKSEYIVHHPPVVDERLVITYTCKQCSTSYRTIETFTAHTCTLPAASPPILQCDECSFTTQSSRILSEHADTHLKVNLVFKCKLCGYHGNTMRGMRQHGRQHMMSGEEFCDDDVESMELPITVQRVSAPALPMKIPTTVDEELLRLKNEPYKKRRSRKHYQKSEYSMTPTASIPPMPQISPQRKENGMSALQIVRPDSASPHSSSTVSCSSPLQQISTSNIPQDNGSEKSNSSPPPSMVKQEPTEIIVDSTTSSTSPQSPSVALPAPHKPHVCSCNASFASMSTFEAHKKLYCPHYKSQQRSHTTITVNN